jgi:hypothetical protein
LRGEPSTLKSTGIELSQDPTPKKEGIRSGISGSKVVWVYFLSTSFEDAEGWALTYTRSGPELVRPLRPTSGLVLVRFTSAHFGSLRPTSVHFGPLRPTCTSAHFCDIPRARWSVSHIAVGVSRVGFAAEVRGGGPENGLHVHPDGGLKLHVHPDGGLKLQCNYRGCNYRVNFTYKP